MTVAPPLGNDWSKRSPALSIAQHHLPALDLFWASFFVRVQLTSLLLISPGLYPPPPPPPPHICKYRSFTVNKSWITGADTWIVPNLILSSIVNIVNHDDTNVKPLQIAEWPGIWVLFVVFWPKSRDTSSVQEEGWQDEVVCTRKQFPADIVGAVLCTHCYVRRRTLCSICLEIWQMCRDCRTGGDVLSFHTATKQSSKSPTDDT